MGVIGPPADYDEAFDVVVAGTGAAGLVAATLAHDGGSRVLVVEKSGLVGGTTGFSGGMPWIPMNRHMAEVGISDSREEALAYIHRLTLGREPDPALVQVYVDRAVEMLDYLEARTPLRMSAPTTFNDYYALFDGGKEAGRSIEPAPFEGAALGDHATRVRTSPHLPWLTMEEGAKFLRGDAPPDMEAAGKRQADDVRVLGPALVAALYRGLMDRGVEVRVASPVESLVVDGGSVVGVTVATPDGPKIISAAQGVVLATGGFEWNRAMVQAFIGLALSPLSPPSNEGDGHRMAMAAGAGLANMGSHWGQPAVAEPGFVHDGRPLVQMASFRSAPGVVVVNRHGRRFVNEGATYQDFPKVLHAYDPVTVDYPNEPPTWAVFDQAVKDRTVILPSVLPGSPAPEWIHSSDSLAGLAETIGVDAEALEETIANWNAHVDAGTDSDHHRGTTRFETHMTGHPPVESDLLAPVSSAPFYAVELKNGTLGTNGGLRIDADGRVLDWAGSPIPGLYAAGNVTASVFGPAYPGGGATIGPAMTFGYLAGRHVAGRERLPTG